ncbi:MAG: hypothetical protein ACRDUV_07235 [Pseudonocardiaceae bacterium]
MSNRRRKNLLLGVVLGVWGTVNLVLGVISSLTGDGVSTSVILFAINGSIFVVFTLGRRSRGSQIPASRQAISPLAPRTLRWVPGFLPSDEGAAWLAEVLSAWPRRLTRARGAVICAAIAVTSHG